ncbi:MAG: diaminopimelate epimerase [Candidatus Margulisiibacteriota bacterium]
MKHKLHFTKMQGLGNDFILIDGLNQRLDGIDFSKAAEGLCDRHFGIGADGVILVLPSTHSDFKMRIFNADGSEPQMCGNGIRCFAKFVYDEQLTQKDVISVETLAGVMVPALILEHGVVKAVEVDMGEPVLQRSRIPITGPDSDTVVDEVLAVDGQTFQFTGVSMGNPHAVVFVDDLTTIDLNRVGPLCEHHALFPERVNTEFVQINAYNDAVMLVWERGSGATLACGTGACAVVVAGVLGGKLNRKSTVHLPGGDLYIDWQADDNHVMMTGPADTVFKGEVDF